MPCLKRDSKTGNMSALMRFSQLILKTTAGGLAIDKLVKSEKRRVIIMTLKPSLIKQAVDYWGLLNVKVIYSHTEYSDELLEEIKEAVF